MELYDISPPITPELAVWPGDTPLSRQILMRVAAGDSVDLSTLHATVHLGAHADAPSHYRSGAPGISERQLDYYLGPCEVVSVTVGRGERVTPRHLAHAPRAPRVLFRTGTYPDPTKFNIDFAALSAELIVHLAERGVRLAGIDTPSIDLFESKDLPAHHACAQNDVANLEGVVLTGVPDGVYELIALPLRLVGFDASPVRAVLRAQS
jgi:arylformamidase